jgi:hypothetical protein
MAGFQTNSTDHLIRANLWTADLKMVLEEQMIGMQFVEMITDFPDGDTMNLPSLGQPEVLDYAEGQAIRYTAMDTGNFTFSITDYKASATYVTNKMKQDSYIMDRVVAAFVPKQNYAIMQAIESSIMALGPDAQTASNSNTINGGKHRFVASGTNQVMTLKEFYLAKYALDVANVPAVGRVAIVDPSVEVAINAITNLTNVSNNPTWEGIITTGMATGMRFLKNVYGFDVYVSMNLKSGISETIDSVSVTNGVANLFFSAAPEVLPFVGNIRQAPTVDSEYNKDLQRDEYITTCRYGFKLYRPENMVVVLSDASRVYA